MFGIIFIVAVFLIIASNQNKNNKFSIKKNTGFQNVKRQHKSDKSVYLDKRNEKKIQGKGEIYAGKSVAQAKTQTRKQRANVVEADFEPIQAAQQMVKEKETLEHNKGNHTAHKKPKLKSIRNKHMELTSTVEEYHVDYGGEAIEYPDISHIWDDLNPNLFSEEDNMITCKKCGTKNIVIRSKEGICNCYFCQEELL